MKSKFVRRIAAIASSAVLAVGAVCMFAGCTSKHPVVTITYTFNEKDYAVDYELSRISAPRTVQHFIELADAGYYDGTCIHDYDSNYLYGGGYNLVNGTLEEKDYFAVVKELEEAGNKFTQTVWKTDTARTPLYTLYGEFSENGNIAETQEYRHKRGALVMYYTDKTDSAKGIDVTVQRNDNGKNADGEKYQTSHYALNSATSLFYTFLGQSQTTNDAKYAVFGMVKDLSSGSPFESLLTAITEYSNSLTSEDDDEVKFTEEQKVTLDEKDHYGDPDFESVQKGGVQETFNTPVDKPIIVTSVKVKKY